MENTNPEVVTALKARIVTAEEELDEVYDEIDSREIFDLIRHINDPEHPLTLEELKVIQQDLIQVNNKDSFVSVYFTPTIPHCSMATLIGLSIRVCLLRSLPNRFKVDVNITPGSHMSEKAINKQLADKERIAAAIENEHLLKVLHKCLDMRKSVHCK